MATIDKRVDDYMAKSADFAKPILIEIRARVHKACPEAVETIKWGFPHFVYREKILCSMAAFKAHCALGFWQADVLKIDATTTRAMGDFGRLMTLKDLPTARQFSALVKQAMQHIDAGTARRAPTKKAIPKALVTPDDFHAAIVKNKVASGVWGDFSHTKQKDYIDWINEAKREATRLARIQQAVEWIAEDKGRNWKYERC